MSGVMIHHANPGYIVIKRGWGFVTRSNLMPYKDAVKLARELNRDERKKERGGGIK